ncbi:hypothetical protein PFDG_05490 [Plasmodium falciparum Dd2]|uniref:Uncharacterized protein n=1 Tax=Plasmodium falciparum (isolate Dd2) TaxID=57267 RepID=A0A0L7M1E0_PLAF4|nr:hypothetical protein PFDG_05490 [Plasmodium falciparum Dd2]
MACVIQTRQQSKSESRSPRFTSSCSDIAIFSYTQKIDYDINEHHEINNIDVKP